MVGGWTEASDSLNARQADITAGLVRCESWAGPIAMYHRGNKVAKIGTRAGNGFYWRTNQEGGGC